MTPYEMMLSESQERMLLVPKPGKEAEVQEVFQRWEWKRQLSAGLLLTVDSAFCIRAKWWRISPVKALTDLVPIRQRRGAEPERF